MPRTKITEQQKDDHGAKYMPSRRKIRRECAKLRRARKAKGPRRKKDELGGIREFGHKDLGLSEPFELDQD